MAPAQRFGSLCIVLSLAMPAGLRASSSLPEDSVRQRVQSFYDWYTAKANGSRGVPAWVHATRQRRGWFSPQLSRALAADAAAQARTKGDVTGLDFDPFLNTQDPEEHYEAHSARCEAGVCSVPVFPRGDTTGHAAVTAEMTQRAGQWRFTNFRYPEGRDLLQVLRALETERTPQR